MFFSRQKLGYQLQTDRIFKVGEVGLVFLNALLILSLLGPLAGENIVWKQAVVWLVNLTMLAMVGIGAWLRQESWSAFGLSTGPFNLRLAGRYFLLSLLVLALAVCGFMVGSVLMVNITGMPQNADLTNYDYLKGNPGMLVLTLLGVYFISSFGEEVIYRAFLINRFMQLIPNPRIGRLTAIAASSIIFGLVHYEWGPMGIAQTTFMGAALAISYLWLNRRLWILILAHAYMDTILMVQLYLSSNG